MRKTKIVCTLGPASATEEVMEQMLKAGMNVARLYFSHGTYESHQKFIDTFRKVRDRLGLPAAVMLDTKGPEIRIKNFKNGSVVLKDGGSFTLTTEEVEGDENKVSISYKDLPGQLRTGQTVLVDDGKIILKTVESIPPEIKCAVMHGGELRDHKSINIPHSRLEMEYLSEPDKQDLLFGIKNDVDFISASFVRRKEDVTAMRKFLDYHGGQRIRIIAKIENIEGIENFDEILAQADGIMVARGDMGVEVEYERLPGLQKVFIKRCYQSGKMVITATQMLESMIV
ncbi:MAG: pyruvate kinase, partial [Oscillospiraceae bacterium]|nr:pyruvate kinase [Oscillospiraceae bacterium]